MADPSLAGLVNVLSASHTGVPGGTPISSPQVSIQQLAQKLAGWQNQPGVPAQQHGLGPSWIDPHGSGELAPVTGLTGAGVTIPGNTPQTVNPTWPGTGNPLPPGITPPPEGFTGPGGYGPETPRITGGTTPANQWKQAGKTPSGIGSTQYPVYNANLVGNSNTPTTTINGTEYYVDPGSGGYETYLRTILAAAGGGPGINNVGTTANPEQLAGYGETPNWEPWMLGTIKPV